ncbi:hypothetical protein V6N11_082621 [Hibiscus sabdariffa]|uniref:Secreted protein n=1 Tax=Hibiscus sabdariffa TaxID=183260 RepID=A0ABR2P993_9ROSI
MLLYSRFLHYPVCLAAAGDAVWKGSCTLAVMCRCATLPSTASDRPVDSDEPLAATIRSIGRSLGNP